MGTRIATTVSPVAVQAQTDLMLPLKTTLNHSSHARHASHARLGLLPSMLHMHGSQPCSAQLRQKADGITAPWSCFALAQQKLDICQYATCIVFADTQLGKVFASIQVHVGELRPLLHISLVR